MSGDVRVTIAVPEAMIDNANQLSGVLGYSEDDKYTFTHMTHRDADGNEYCVASGLVKPSFIDDAQADLVAPAWPVDMAAANVARSKLAIWTEEQPFIAVPEYISAVWGDEVDSALAKLQLEKL